MPPDALHVSRMNIGPGGAQSTMHDTIIPSSNPKGLGGTPQSMQFPTILPNDDPNKPFEGKPKGIRQILEERGLVTITQKPSKADPSKTTITVYNSAGNKIVGQCKLCKEAKVRRPPDVTAPLVIDIASESEGEEERMDCCMTQMLNQQEDFKNQKSMLEEVSTLFHCDITTD